MVVSRDLYARRSLMVATPGASPPQARPPPPLPNDPTITNLLSNYLNQFSLWCRQGFAAKLNANTALSGIMLQASDAPAGEIPAVFLLQVQSDGTVVTTLVTTGGANPIR
jgi:hypothetical protein